MNKEELYEFLDIEDPSDFRYFENFSAYIECDENIEDNALYGILKEADRDLLSEIVKNYFNEIIDALPDEGELIGIFDVEQTALRGMLRSGDESSLGLLVEELERFRNYYSVDREVEVKNLKDGSTDMMSICDAVFTARGEKFDGSEHSFNFNSCLSYSVDEYAMSFSDMLELEEEEE
ncbi:MAG: hypothetical protein MJ171_07955 [Clostridia bacterium]|nr:hypothetical protein [Clostridia bacterium]